MQDNSSQRNAAVGLCPSCKAIITYKEGEAIASCPNCFGRQSRYASGAVDNEHQKYGYCPGGSRR
jgi:uncharacterized CHY-type Zn-finger protein